MLDDDFTGGALRTLEVRSKVRVRVRVRVRIRVRVRVRVRVRIRVRARVRARVRCCRRRPPHAGGRRQHLTLTTQPSP